MFCVHVDFKYLLNHMYKNDKLHNIVNVSGINVQVYGHLQYIQLPSVQ